MLFLAARAHCDGVTSPEPPRAPEDEDAPPSRLRDLVRELVRRRVLRAAAWYVGASVTLVQAADVFQQGLSLPDGTVRFLAVGAVCGLPVVVVLSWAYDVSADRAEGRSAWGRAALVTAVVLGALTTAGLWLRGSGDSDAAPAVEDPMPPNRVAILALDAPGASPETVAFASYLQERLIEGLSAAAANVSDSSRLRVISRAGTLPYSNGTLTTDSIGRALRAGTLVSGMVEEVGARVRVRLQLIDAASAEVLATRQIEADAVAAIRLVDAVADSLGLMVRQSLGEVLRERVLRLETRSQRAFQQLLQSEHWKDDFDEALRVRDLDRAQRALDEADQALARAESLDRQWVEPVVGRAMLAYLGGRLAQSRGERDLAPVYARGLAHGERAVRMAPQNAEAHHARGALRAMLAMRAWHTPDEHTPDLLRGAEDDLRLAAAGSPRPADPLRRLSELFAAEGRLEEALSYGRRAYDEDPYLESTRESILRLFESSFRLDRDAEAAEWCAEGRRRFRDVPYFEDCRLLLMAWSSMETADPDTAWALVARELGPYPAALRAGLEPRLHALAAAVLARAGQPDSARAVLTRALEQDPGTAGVHIAAAGVEALLGDRDTAMERVGRALELAPGERAKLAGAPELRPLRDLPAFRVLTGAR